MNVPCYRRNFCTFYHKAVSPIDSSLSRIENHRTHPINNTYIANHFFLRIPHYRVFQVIEHFKNMLEKRNEFDYTPVFVASWNQCCFVEDGSDLVFCQN